MKLFNVIEKMKDVRALVVGDAIHDQYVFGNVSRLCPEGPVPVLVSDKIETRRGGAAHVMEQIDALCMPAVISFGTPVSTKTRYLAGSHLLLRVDADKAPVFDEEQKARALTAAMGNFKFDVIVLSDYNKGWLTLQMCQFLIEYARQKNIPVVVDPKGSDWRKYVGCTWICPNQVEIEAFRDIFIPSGGKRQFPQVLQKRGADGLKLWTDGSGSVEIPSTAKHVFDVTGAGDTVVAVFAAALAAGGTEVQAAQLANLAAGWTVGEIGTVVCSRETLHDLTREYEQG